MYLCETTGIKSNNGGGQILSKGYNLDTLGRGPIDKATKFGNPRPNG